jgi:iron complex outermembrane receptor protein
MTKFYLYLSRYLMVGLLFGTTMAWSQGRTVTGKVSSSDDGGTIPGANILEKGTSNGTITGTDGVYTITVQEGAILVFSFVGYQSQEIAVGTQSNIEVVLQADVTSLNEVVVIGYGEIKKRDATGAVASVKAEDFNTGVISSPEQLIQGKTAGVQITSASGEPGAGANIRIRGTSSVRGGNNPLYVVDGVPLAGDDVSGGGLDIGRGNAPTKNPLNFLNPSDIESIDILKDASATAIYGSRGANGVVLITTKSGKGKRRQLEYGATLSFARVARKYDLLNRDQFLNGAARLGSNLDELDYGADTDWQDAVLRTSVSNRHDLSFSDNYKTLTYRASFSYDNQQGIVENTGLKRYTGRLNLNKSFLNDKLKVGTQMIFSRVDDQAAAITQNSGFEGDLIGSMIMANPTWARFADSQFSNTNINPLAYLKYHQDNTQTDRHLINVTGSYDILPSLSFKVTGGFDRSESTRDKVFSPKLRLSNGVEGNGRGGFAEIETSNDLLEAYFNYNKTIGKGTISAVLGYSYQEFNRKGMTVLGWGFAGEDMDRMVDDLHGGAGVIQGMIDQPYQQFGYYTVIDTENGNHERMYINTLTPEPTTIDLDNIPATMPVRSITGDIFNSTDELQSFFGRVNYSLLDKYLLTATFRADGSTRFGGNNKYGYFPSASAAWRLSEEAFVPEAFSDLKFRVGYGVTGNQEIPHNLHQARIKYNNRNNNQFGAPTIGNDGQAPPPGTSNVAFENPDLKWEQTSQLNIGLDFGFLENKLTGSIDVYRKNTTDLLIQVTSAQPAPQPFTWRNLDADVINQGVELTLNAIAVESDNFGLNLGFNISYNKNKVENYAGAPLNTGEINGQGLSGAFAQRIVNNQPLFTYFIREFQGFDQDGIAIYNGDFQRYVDKNPIPKYNLGFSVNFRYKNWDVSTFLAGQYDFWVYNNTANAYFSLGSLATGKNIQTNSLYTGESAANAPDASTRYLEKGDFLRMQNLNLGYNFNFEQTSLIKKLRLYASGQNLFLITGYSGLDPEVNTNKARDGVPSLGIDYTAYPRARTLTFGLNATF